MNYYKEREKNGECYDSVKNGSKRIGCFAAASGFIPFFNIFGFSTKNTPLFILFIFFICLEVLFVTKFIIFNNRTKLNRKIKIIEDLVLVMGVVIGILLSFFFVKQEYDGDKLIRINYTHMEFWIIDFSFMLILGFVLAKKTKKNIW